MTKARFVYISFDVVPAPKGAAIHIEAFAKALAAAFGSLNLVTVSATAEIEDWGERWPGVAHIALPARGKTLIDRVLFFRQQLEFWWQGQWFESVQIRSIYEGFPIALQKSQLCNRLIFEVNGLPSIELKYRYPRLIEDLELMHKLMTQEQICLRAADLIVTPSSVTRDYLCQLGLSSQHICVIPNGVDLALFSYQSPRSESVLSPLRLFYFGTLSAWQGVSLAVEALALYCRDFAAELTIVGAARPSQVAALNRLAAKLDVASQVTFLDPLPQSELAVRMQEADAIVAPLTPNDRNLVQGCCPLKVLEGMASGTPVITSDLPVVNELGTNEVHFLAVRAGSAKAIKDAMLRLRVSPGLRERLSLAARSRIEQEYTWQRAGRALTTAYRQLVHAPVL